MEFIKLTDIKNKYFEEAWEIYEASFPIEERRSKQSQSKIISHANYHYEIILYKKQILGFLLWWNFDDLRFIEHFAIKEIYRGKGFGKIILETFKNLNANPIYLEVDIPYQNSKQRRIEFYQRSGFHLNHHFYQQPPLHKNYQALTLLLMSYPNPISIADIEHFKKHYYPIIYQIKIHI